MTEKRYSVSLIETAWIPKDISPKQAIRYQSSIVHQVHPTQRELAGTLKEVQAATHEFVEYLPIGRLGITLARLDPVIKKILGADKRGVISDVTRRDFEAEINDSLKFPREYQVDVENPELPLTVAADTNALSIKLSMDDPQLYGERVLVERYVRREYPTASARFGDDIVSWEPGVTIGYIKPEALSTDQYDDLLDDPSLYISQAVYDARAYSAEQFGLEQPTSRIVFPESISLSGLGVVCNRQESRIF